MKPGGANYDLVVVGGGLAGGLAAMAAIEAWPDARIAVAEAGPSLGGNHYWSYFATDLDAAGHALVAPLVDHRWSGHTVRFPGFDRRLAGDYATIGSERFDAVVRDRLGEGVRLGVRAAQLTPDGVTLDDGTRLSGPVLDARGVDRTEALTGGWQKFVGQTLRVKEPHGIAEPVIMDASVDQSEGYRFVYLLPMGPREIFVEDTYYRTEPGLDDARLRDRIAEYAFVRGWKGHVLHEERGVIPVVTGGRFAKFWREGGAGIAKAGVRAGLFHPLTSFSLPFAVRFALALARTGPPQSGAALHGWTRAHADAHWRRMRFYRLLGRMLLHAAEPQDRYRVLARFYQLPEPVIARFYAGQCTLADKARLLCGRAPVRIDRALLALAGLAR